jgi:serine/threonine-protein kinase
MGLSMGTPAYMAPEQARGRWNLVDARSDVFSVGATMFALLTGQLVHQDETVPELLAAMFSRPARPLTDAMPGAQPLLSLLVDTALRLDKKDRWQDARAMQSALRDAYLEAFGAAIPAAPRMTKMSASNLVAAPVAISDMRLRAVEFKSPSPLTDAHPTEQAVASDPAPFRGRRHAPLWVGASAALGVTAIATVFLGMAGAVAPQSATRSPVAAVAPPPALAAPLNPSDTPSAPSATRVETTLAGAPGTASAAPGVHSAPAGHPPTSVHKLDSRPSSPTGGNFFDRRY